MPIPVLLQALRRGCPDCMWPITRLHPARKTSSLSGLSLPQALSILYQLMQGVNTNLAAWHVKDPIPDLKSGFVFSHGACENPPRHQEQAGISQVLVELVHLHPENASNELILPCCYGGYRTPHRRLDAYPGHPRSTPTWAPNIQERPTSKPASLD